MEPMTCQKLDRATCFTQPDATIVRFVGARLRGPLEWPDADRNPQDAKGYAGALASGRTCSCGVWHERCIEYKTETGLWNDEKCYRADRVICEWDNLDPYDWRPGNEGY